MAAKRAAVHGFAQSGMHLGTRSLACGFPQLTQEGDCGLNFPAVIVQARQTQSIEIVLSA